MGRFGTALLLLFTTACARNDAPGTTYYERTIQPILTASCGTAGGGLCHADDGSGRANGNLDVTSYEALTRRADVLRRFGSYPYPLLLMKGLSIDGSMGITMQVGDVPDVPLNILHGGGQRLTINSDAFMTLQMWLENGHTENGLPPLPGEPKDRGDCSSLIRFDLFAQPTLDAVDTGSPGYVKFQSEVWPWIKGGTGADGQDYRKGCLGRECHGMRDSNGVPTNELYFTCGDDDTQQRFNYLMARTYSGASGRGQLSEKPLAGGSYHDGGKLFASVQDPAYVAIRDWSAMDPPYELRAGEGEKFFRFNVQPVLASRGCYLEACHSLVNFNFYKPLAGTDGLFGTRLLLHNYLQARFMLGLASPDPTKGRLLEKNLVSSEGGIPHRGGPVLGSMGQCNLDVDTVRADPSHRWFEEARPACIVATWFRLERKIAVETGELTDNPGTVGVFVRRPANPDRHIDFDNYRPGADLMRMDLDVDASGRITGLAGPPTSLLGNCGVAVADADVRRPDINGTGTRVVFAMRTSASEGLDLWQVDIDGSNCARLGLPQGTDANGTPIHHFDPAYAPGGAILFASTMGDPADKDPLRQVPTRTPRYFLPNSNIWVFAPGGTPQKLSYLNGAELMPRLERTREIIYAVEKAAPDFYQISTRALRLDDGGGYRPQLGQRPNMGYGQIMEMRELTDFRTAYIASDPGTYFGGGTLSVQDLTLGLEELNFTDKGFPHPTHVLDPSAAARPGVVGTGAYRSPTPLPDGRILVAYSPGSVDLGDKNANVDYGLWVVDPNGIEAPWKLFDTPGEFDIEPVVAFKRIWVPQPNRIQQGDDLRGEYVFHSVPLFAALLNDHSRVSTVPNDDVKRVRVLEQMPVPANVTSQSAAGSNLYGGLHVYVKRRLIGEAPLLDDGSIRLLVPSRTPLVLQLLDKDGNIIETQQEEEQIGPGETQPRLAPVSLFNAVCGGCHNALDGSELEVDVGPDVTTGASTRSEAARLQTKDAVDLYTPPDERTIVPIQ